MGVWSDFLIPPTHVPDRMRCTEIVERGSGIIDEEPEPFRVAITFSNLNMFDCNYLDLVD